MVAASFLVVLSIECQSPVIANQRRSVGVAIRIPRPMKRRTDCRVAALLAMTGDLIANF